jgi:hypothetical protein
VNGRLVSQLVVALMVIASLAISAQASYYYGVP